MTSVIGRLCSSSGVLRTVFVCDSWIKWDFFRAPSPLHCPSVQRQRGRGEVRRPCHDHRTRPTLATPARPAREPCVGTRGCTSINSERVYFLLVARRLVVTRYVRHRPTAFPRSDDGRCGLRLQTTSVLNNPLRQTSERDQRKRGQSVRAQRGEMSRRVTESLRRLRHPGGRTLSYNRHSSSHRHASVRLQCEPPRRRCAHICNGMPMYDVRCVYVQRGRACT